MEAKVGLDIPSSLSSTRYFLKQNYGETLKSKTDNTSDAVIDRNYIISRD